MTRGPGKGPRAPQEDPVTEVTRIVARPLRLAVLFVIALAAGPARGMGGEVPVGGGGFFPFPSIQEFVRLTGVAQKGRALRGIEELTRSCSGGHALRAPLRRGDGLRPGRHLDEDLGGGEADSIVFGSSGGPARR